MEINLLLWFAASLAIATYVWSYSFRRDDFRPIMAMLIVGFAITVFGSIYQGGVFGPFLFGIGWFLAAAAPWGIVAVATD